MQAVQAARHTIPADSLGAVMAGVSTDSRTVGEGDVFFAVRGERFDGADFVDDAVRKGAACAVVNGDSLTPALESRPVVVVGDTVRALGDAARDYRSLFDRPVIAVTGTNGKTTAKEMMLAVLGVRYAVHGTKGNLNNHIGVPLSVFGLERHHQCAVFELGMSAPGEIAALADIVNPGIGVVLNAGPAHMEFFQSLEAVADAKMELLEALGPGDTAVVNGDDDLLRKCPDKTDADIIRFGVRGGWDVRGEHITVDEHGRAAFTCGGVRVGLAVPGVHNVYNALAAIAVGTLLNIGIREAASALASFTAPGMRMQTIERDGVTYINDSYNANPLSMKTAASVLGSMAVSGGGRKIAVLGDMLELGEISESAHREVGALFGCLGVDLMCLVGEWAEAVAEGARSEGIPPGGIRIVGDSGAAAEFVESIRRPGDVILVKGSRGMRMERVIPPKPGE